MSRRMNGTEWPRRCRHVGGVCAPPWLQGAGSVETVWWRDCAGHGRYEPTDSPMDWSAGAARLNDVLRASKAFSSTTVATAPTAGTAGVMSADEKLSYKQHAASIPSLGNSPSAVDLRRAASGALVGELATIQSVLASRGFPLSGNEATDVQLAVSIFGKAALAVVCSCGKADSRVQGEIPALTCYPLLAFPPSHERSQHYHRIPR